MTTWPHRLPSEGATITLPIEMSRRQGVARADRVCIACGSGAVRDERHALLECATLADVRDRFPDLIAGTENTACLLLWHKVQMAVLTYVTACLTWLPDFDEAPPAFMC